MLRRHELRSQQPELPMRPNETQRLTLAPLLKTFCGWEEMHAEHLRIITDHIEEVSDERRIGDYDLTLPLIRDDGTGGLTFTATHAILELTLSILQPEYPKSPDKHKLLLELSAYGQAEGTLYVQATLVQLPPSAVESTCRTSEAARAAVKTFVIPFDTKSAHDRQVEFEYFLKDAQDKIREKRYQDLTPEQVAMVNCDRPEISYDLYWAIIISSGKVITRRCSIWRMLGAGLTGSSLRCGKTSAKLSIIFVTRWDFAVTSWGCLSGLIIIWTPCCPCAARTTRRNT